MDSEQGDPPRVGLVDYSSDSSSISSNSSDVSDIWGDQVKLPRVGNEYQVEIPPLTTESEHLHLIKTPTNSESFRVGLPVPIVWVHNEIDSTRFVTNTSVETKRKRTRNSSKKEASKLRIEPSNFALDCEGRLGRLEVKETKEKAYFPVPGCLGSSWSDLEKECFLLGLYIFGKNLDKVKRFVESKEMGDIVSFYYGEFYSTIGHRAWCKSRKRQGRRHIHGQKMFTDWRQREFLSRLLPRVPKEQKTILKKVSKTFEEGKIELEEYVSSLKAKVGLSTLIEVFGIGKGEQDLTTIVVDSARNSVPSSRSDKPIGKVSLNLTYGDIIRVLTGGVRKSKAKSEDLFREAIWPRLLAKGWHSEQPKLSIGTSSKHSMVFIIPGIKKFSRKKLVKGDHYFDSITDVLDKVALEPELIELEFESSRDETNRENGCGKKKMKLDELGDSNHLLDSYLKPQLRKSMTDLMEFTIVDTSLGNEEGGDCSLPCRELRRLPVDTTDSSDLSSSPSENEEGFDDPVDQPDGLLIGQGESNSSIPEEDMSVKPVQLPCSDSLVSFPILSEQETQTNESDDIDITMERLMDHNAGKPEKKLNKVIIKCQFSRRKKPEKPNNLSPVTKRRRLTACFQEDASFQRDSSSVGYGTREDDTSLELGFSSAGDNVVSDEVGVSRNNVSIESAHGDTSEGMVSENSIDKSESLDKHLNGDCNDMVSDNSTEKSESLDKNQNGDCNDMVSENSTEKFEFLDKHLNGDCNDMVSQNSIENSESVDKHLNGDCNDMVSENSTEKFESVDKHLNGDCNDTVSENSTENLESLDKHLNGDCSDMVSENSIEKPESLDKHLNGDCNDMVSENSFDKSESFDKHLNRDSNDMVSETYIEKSESLDKHLNRDGDDMVRENSIQKTESLDKHLNGDCNDMDSDSIEMSESLDKHLHGDFNDSIPNPSLLPPDLETNEPFAEEVKETQSDPFSLKETPLPSNKVNSKEKQPVVAARRHSTRNRKITKRALEAFACGYMTNNRKPRQSSQAQQARGSGSK